MSRRPPRRLARLAVVTAALAAFLALPALAPAATLRINGAQVQFIAGANEPNYVTFERTATLIRGFDAGADLDAGSGCAQVTDNVVTCPHAGITSIRATLGNLDDSIAVEGSTPAELLGQAGVDSLIGGSGPDELDAGEGVADFLDGRGGNDELLAEDASGTVKLDGGPGDDTLQGNTAPGDAFFGFQNLGPFGFGGSSAFVGDTGRDIIVGSNGSDFLQGGPGPDDLSGGTGGVDIALYSERTEPLTVNLSNGGATDGGATDEGTVGGNLRRDSITGVEGVAGGTANDVLTGSPVADIIVGSFGSDTINGAAGGDSLCGEGGGFLFTQPEASFVGSIGCSSSQPGGNDDINGGAGDDLLIGGFGADELVGGGDVDHADYSDRSSPVRAQIEDLCSGAPCAKNNDGQVDVDPVTGGNQPEQDRIALDVENLGGGQVDDILIGSARANRIDGNQGGDDISGRDGNDLLCGDGSPPFFGNPVFRGNPCPDTGSVGDDALDGEGGDDFLQGGRGRDTLNGGADDDTVSWQERSNGVDVTIEDTCTGTPCAKNNDGQVDIDPVTAGNQGERDRVGLDVENLIGTNGKDDLAGSNSRNLLAGLGDTDTLSGLDGPDVLSPNGGIGDVVDGGPSRDLVSYRFDNGPVNVTIDNVANDGGSFPSTFAPNNQNVKTNIEGILGTVNGDNLSGPTSAARNTILGYGGGDSLQGFAGDDTVDGGPGGDTMRGGTGDDLLTAADQQPDSLIDCDNGGDPGGGAADRVVFDIGVETPTNCETQSPVSITASTGSLMNPRSAAFHELERRLAGLHRFAQLSTKAKRKARRAARKAAGT